MSVSRMKKLTVLVHASDTDAIVKRLVRLGCVELQDNVYIANNLK